MGSTYSYGARHVCPGPPCSDEASDVLSTALALKTGGDDNDGKGIKKSGG